MLLFTTVLCFQNPYFSYIQEHLAPYISIWISPCIVMIYQACQNNSYHYVILNCRINELFIVQNIYYLYHLLILRQI